MAFDATVPNPDGSGIVKNDFESIRDNFAHLEPIAGRVDELVNLEDAMVNVKDFGAVGDGEADDLNSIENAIEYCLNNNKPLFLDGSTYYISDRINFNLSNYKNTLIIIGNNSTIKRNDNNYSDKKNNNIITFYGEYDNDSPIISDIDYHNRKIEVENADIFEKDDIIRIVTDELFAVRLIYSTEYNKTFYSTIQKIDKNTIIVNDDIPYNFSSSNNMKLQKRNKINDLNIIINNLNLEWDSELNDVDTRGIVIRNLDNILINNVICNKTQTGFIFERGYNYKISNITTKTQKINDVELRYGMVISDIHNSLFNNMWLQTSRQTFDTSGSPCNNVIVNNCYFYSDEGRSYGSHNAEKIIFNNCLFNDGIQLANGNFTFNNCYISDQNRQHSIWVRKDANFIKSINLNNCNINIKEHEYDNIFILASFSTGFKYIGDINLNNNNFYGEKIQHFIRFDGEITENIDEIKSIIIKNNTFNSIVERLLTYNIVDTSFNEKNVMIIKDNLFKSYETSDVPMIKNDILNISNDIHITNNISNNSFGITFYQYDDELDKTIKILNNIFRNDNIDGNSIFIQDTNNLTVILKNNEFYEGEIRLRDIDKLILQQNFSFNNNLFDVRDTNVYRSSNYVFNENNIITEQPTSDEIL